MADSEADEKRYGMLDDTRGGLEERVAALERIIYQTAHRAATLGSGTDGWLRGRFMSLSNALNASIGRAQSSHGDQFDASGNIVKHDPLNERV